MSDEQRTITSIADLFQTMWFWLVPLAGGVGDYIVQAQRGLKPRQPLRVVITAMVTHSVVAVFAGVVLALGVGALGYTGEMAFGAAGGIGGFLGVRLFDIGVLLIKLKTGAEPK